MQYWKELSRKALFFVFFTIHSRRKKYAKIFKKIITL